MLRHTGAACILLVGISLTADWPGPSKACAQAPVVAAAPGKIPESLVDTGEYGENIYDAAKAKDWDAAAMKLAALKEADAKLKKDMPAPTPEQKKCLDQIDANIAALDKSIPARDQRETLIKSNQITVLIADLTVPMHPKTPAAVTRLDYLGRELEIWSAAGDMAKLKTAAADLQATWSAVRPDVESKGGKAESRKFSELVAKMGKATTASDYAKVAGPILDEVDNLERVFGK